MERHAKPLPRVMVDANVLAAGNAFPRWPYEILRHASRGDYRLFLCPHLLEEARRTMSRGETTIRDPSDEERRDH